MTPEEAINRTIEEMPDDFQIKSFIMENKEAVTDAFLTEYDENQHIQNEKKISHDEGFIEGQERERKNTEREKKRADEAEQRANEAEELLKKYRETYGKLE